MCNRWQNYFLIGLISFLLTSCASTGGGGASGPYLADANGYSGYNGDLPLYQGQAPYSSAFSENAYYQRMPQQIDVGKEKVVLVDPKNFAWGAYGKDGKLQKAGIAVAGAEFCEDVGRPCRTSVGTFRIYSVGGEGCISKTYPVGRGGSLMPYCMFFHGGESLHGTPDQMLTEQHVSHGCIRMRIPAAEWLRNNFAHVGTKVIVLPY